MPKDNSEQSGALDDADFSRLTRPRYPIPKNVSAALDANRLWPAYRSRPAYQQNDYIGWIARAKRATTRQKRLDQMLDELQRGDVYMKMAWRNKSK